MRSQDYRAVKEALDRFVLAREPTAVLARDLLGSVAQLAATRLDAPVSFGIGSGQMVRHPEAKAKR
jgi:hypothetical protein